jgi:hypothetical protein
MPVPADSQSIPHREIVIAENGEHAVGSAEPGDARRRLPHMAKAFMDEIAGQGDQVGFLSEGTVDGLIEIRRGQLGADMQVRQLSDPKPVKRRRQIADRHSMVIHFQPRRLDVTGIMKASEIASEPMGAPACHRWALGGGHTVRTSTAHDFNDIGAGAGLEGLFIVEPDSRPPPAGPPRFAALNATTTCAG